MVKLIFSPCPVRHKWDQSPVDFPCCFYSVSFYPFQAYVTFLYTEKRNSSQDLNRSTILPLLLSMWDYWNFRWDWATNQWPHFRWIYLLLLLYAVSVYALLSYINTPIHATIFLHLHLPSIPSLSRWTSTLPVLISSFHGRIARLPIQVQP